MNKKIIAISLIIALTLGLAACGSDEALAPMESSTETNVTSESDVEADVSNNQDISAVENESNNNVTEGIAVDTAENEEEKNKAYTTKEYIINDDYYGGVKSDRRLARRFSEGKAWVWVCENESRALEDCKLALIDENFNIITFADATRLSDKISRNDLICASPFCKGTSCIYYIGWSYGERILGNGTINIADRELSPGFYIINENGDIIYSSLDEDLYFMCSDQYGGYLLYKNCSGYDSVGYKFCYLDSKMNLTETDIEKGDVWGIMSDEGRNVQPVCLSPGIYAKANMILNLNKGYFHKVCGNFEEIDGDNAIFSSGHTIYSIPISELSDFNATCEEDFYIFFQNHLANYAYNPYLSRIYLPNWSDSLKINISFRADDDSIVQFFDGLDGEYYVTRTDINGDILYEPINYPKATELRGSHEFAYNGYVFYGDIIITPDGTIKHIGENISEIGKDAQFYVYADVGVDQVTNGFFICKNLSSCISYISIDGKQIVYKVTATFDEYNNIVIPE